MLSVAKAQSLKAVGWYKVMAIWSVQAIDIVYVLRLLTSAQPINKKKKKL